MSSVIRENWRLALLFVILAALGAASASKAVADEKPAQPKVGDKAKDFELAAIDGEKVKLSELVKEGPVVLLLLRGYPGYQCPICTKQVGDFTTRAKNFAAAKANVVLVYPGPADKLKEHAEEFIHGKTLPENFRLLLDPDYSFTNSCHLRWDAKNETAYPSTFVIDREMKIQFAKISMKHGGRSSAAEVLKVVSEK